MKDLLVLPALLGGHSAEDASGQWTGVQEIRDSASIYLAQGRGLALSQHG